MSDNRMLTSTDVRRSTAVLLMGGNQGDRRALLQAAVDLVGDRVGEVSRLSSLYETEPWGTFAEGTAQPFLNQAAVVLTELTAEETLRRLQDIERQLGRRRTDGDAGAAVAPASERLYASRPIDIDILLFNADVVELPHLQIPHPRMHLRRFALEPLCELMPAYEHPLLHRSLAELLAACPDTGAVKRLF